MTRERPRCSRLRTGSNSSACPSTRSALPKIALFQLYTSDTAAPWRATRRPSQVERIGASAATQSLICSARRFTTTSVGLDLKDTVYAHDATTIDLCLSVLTWARSARPKRRSSCARAWICVHYRVVHLHQRRQAARRQYPRSVGARARAIYVMDLRYNDFDGSVAVMRAAASASSAPRLNSMPSADTRMRSTDFSVLPDLTDQDLEKLGVLLVDRRKR